MLFLLVNMPTSNSLSHKQRGSSLLEVLIAMLVMSIGMLGMAGLTAASNSYNKLAQIRSSALMLVSDYADRARSNMTGFNAGNYAKTSAYENSQALISTSGCTDTSANKCTAGQMAALDQNQWRNLLRRRLPGGDAYVLTSATAATGQNNMDIWVMWTELDQATGFDVAGNNKCPTAATTDTTVKCMYFRIAL
jgi:type IV pilus assembly protein PilV